MENDSSDSCIKATQILSNIINIYEGDSENKRKEFIQSILLTQYDSLPLITNFLIHKTDTYDNDFLFYNEIEKEFKYVLTTEGNNISKNPFNVSMNYYLSLFLLQLIHSEKEKRFVKECFVLIMNAFSCYTYDGKIRALQITFFQTLLNLLQENDFYKQYEKEKADLIQIGKKECVVKYCDYSIEIINKHINELSYTSFSNDETSDIVNEHILLLKKCIDEINTIRKTIIAFSNSKDDTQLSNNWEQSINEIRKKIYQIERIKNFKRLSLQMKPLLYMLFSIKLTDPSILIETLFESKNDCHNRILNILQDRVFQVKFVNILNSQVINDYFQGTYLSIISKNTGLKTTKPIVSEKMIEAYSKLKEELKHPDKVKQFFEKVFYVTTLPNNLKGYTHRYLRIVINQTGLLFNPNTDEAALNKVRHIIYSIRL